MAASSTIIAELERALRTDAPPGVVAVYLFGSFAEGRAHRESDVDIGVVLDRAAFPSVEARFEERIRLTTRCIEVLHRSLVDLVVLNDVPPRLAAHAATRGVTVYVGNTDLEHAFRRDSQLRAADLAPFLRRTRKLKLDSLDR
ncbi:MAG: type VII toxin-antitoxin system MntA family adenylyltransferase antitoxin [Gemmatimonadota bacterium]